MKVTATKENLQTAIRRVNCAISSRPILPVLSNVKLEAKGEYLYLTATDNEITVSTWIKVLVEEEGTTTLPAKKLLQIVSAFRLGDITIETNTDNQSIVTCQRTTYKIHGLPADGFPDVTKDGSLTFDWSFTMPMVDFIGGINKVSYAKSIDETRRQMNGVALSIRSGILSITATDGRRLAMMEKKISDQELKDGDYIIPNKASNELNRCFDADMKEIKIQLNASMIGFASENTILITKMVEGAFPPFRRVLQQPTDHSVVLPRQMFLDVLSRVALVVMDNSGSIKMTFAKGLLTISASNPESGEASEPLEVDYQEDEEITIAFNPVYFMDPLKVLESDQVTFSFGKSRTSHVKLSGEEGFLYLLMPMLN